MIKRALLNILGYVTYIGIPMVYIASKYDILISKEAETTLSGWAIVGLVVVSPILGKILKKLPIKVNIIGVVMMLFGGVAMYLGDVLFWIGLWATVGSVAGELAFYSAEKVKIKAKEDKTATLIASKLKESANV